MSEGLTGAIASATPETPLNDIAQYFRERKVMSVPVVETGRLVGVISASDLARVPPAEVSAGVVKARQVMSRALVRAYADESLYAAWLRMSRRGLRQLAVVERAHPTRLTGMLTADAIGQLLRPPTARRTNAASASAPASSGTRGSADGEARRTTRHATGDGMGATPAARSAPRLPNGTYSGTSADRAIERLARASEGGDPLANLRVAEAMVRQPRTVLESAPLASVRDQLETANAVLVVAGDGRLVGILARADLRHRADVEHGQPLSAGDVAVRNLVTVSPEETLSAAVRRMNRLGLRQLPVVAGELPAPPLGLLRRTEILAAYGRFLADDKVTITPQ
jgi:CBS domain-containing protein